MGQVQHPGSRAGTAAAQKVIYYLINKKPLALFFVRIFPFILGYAWQSQGRRGHHLDRPQPPVLLPPGTGELQREGQRGEGVCARSRAEFWKPEERCAVLWALQQASRKSRARGAQRLRATMAMIRGVNSCLHPVIFGYSRRFPSPSLLQE